MEFLNGKEELDLVVQALQELLPFANIGQKVKGTTEFLAVIRPENEQPYVIGLRVHIHWVDKSIGAFSLNIESTHEIDKIVEDMQAQKAVDELLGDINLN
jgi:hypothetical protein